MKRIIRTTAFDGDVKIENTLKIEVPKRHCLTRREVEKLARAAARACADGLRDLPYTDFGPENIRVTL